MLYDCDANYEGEDTYSFQIEAENPSGARQKAKQQAVSFFNDAPPADISVHVTELPKGEQTESKQLLNE